MDNRDENRVDLNLLTLPTDVLGEVFKDFSVRDALHFEQTSTKSRLLLSNALVNNARGFFGSRGYVDKYQYLMNEAKKVEECATEPQEIYSRTMVPEIRIRKVANCYGFPMLYLGANVVVSDRKYSSVGFYVDGAFDRTESKKKFYKPLNMNESRSHLLLIHARNKADFDAQMLKIQDQYNLENDAINKSLFIIVACPPGVIIDSKDIDISAVIEFNVLDPRNTINRLAKKLSLILENRRIRGENLSYERKI